MQELENVKTESSRNIRYEKCSEDKEHGRLSNSLRYTADEQTPELEDYIEKLSKNIALNERMHRIKAKGCESQMQKGLYPDKQESQRRSEIKREKEIFEEIIKINFSELKINGRPKIERAFNDC